MLSRLGGISVLVAAAIAFDGGAAFSQTKDPVKIGFLMPLTGGAGKLGELMMLGADYSRDEINAKGGAAGHPLVIIPEDSQGLAKNGVDGFRKLVDVDHAPVIITGWTAVVMAVAPLAQRTETFLLTASTASPLARGLTPYLQSSWMFDDEGIKLLLPYMKKEKKVERLAIMTVLTDLGSGLSAAVKKEWAKLGGAIVAEETHQQQEINFRPSLLKMLAAKPDAIYVTNSSGKESAQFVKQARDLGYKGYFLSYGAYEDPEILAIADKAEGSFFTVPAFDPNSSDPVTRAFVEGFKKKTGKAPNVHQANHYDLVQLVARGVEDLDKAGKPITGANFKDILRVKVPTFHGAAGAYKFDYSDGSVIRPTLLKTVKDGKFVVVTQLGS